MNLARKTLAGIISMSISSNAISVLNLIQSIWLARLLEPNTFGIVSLGVFFFSLIQRLQLNFQYSIVQRPDLTQETLRTQWWLQQTIAVLMLLASLAASPVVARFYPYGVAQVLLVLAGANVLTTLTSTSLHLTLREMRFRSYGLVQWIGALVTLVVSVVLAQAGWPLPALVSVQVMPTVVLAIGVGIVSPYRPQMHFDVTEAWELCRFAAPLWLTGMAYFISYQFDNFLVATLVSVTDLGYYSRAYALALLPGSFLSVISQVMFPVYSQLQGDRERITKAYTMATHIIFRGGLAITGILFAVAPELIVLLVGSKWLPAVPLFRLLTIFSALRPMVDNSNYFFVGLGKPAQPLKFVWVQPMVLLLVGPLLGYLWGGWGIALAVDLMSVVVVVVLFIIIKQHILFSVKALFIPPLLSLILPLGLCMFLDMNWTGMQPWGGLAAKSLLVFILYLVGLLVFERSALLVQIRAIRFALAP